MTCTTVREGAAVDNELSSLDRGLEIVAFVQDQGQVETGDIIARLQIPSSTTYRYVRALKGAGFLAEVDGRIMPSDRMADRTVTRSDHLVDLARPVLTELAERTGTSAALTVRVHAAALSLDARRRGPGRVAFHPGEVLALYAGASALPLLAMAPVSLREQVLRGGVQRFTTSTPDATGLADELDRVRRQGFALSRGWVTPGMSAVGVPVMAGGMCLCALSVIGTDAALDDADGPLRALRQAVESLTARLPRSLSTAWTPPLDDGPANGPEGER